MRVTININESTTAAKLKVSLQRLFKGTRINSVIFNESGTGLAACIERKSNGLDIAIYTRNSTIDYRYTCKARNDEELEVHAANNNYLVSDTLPEVEEYMTALAYQYGKVV